MPRKPGPQLSREDVVQAAARLLEREGYDRLTMRGVAAELGVQAPALYWHVKSKEGLSLLLFDHLIADLDYGAPTGDWRVDLKRMAGVLRRRLVETRDITRLFPDDYSSGPRAARPLELSLGIMRAAGLAPTDAIAAYGTALSYVVGWSRFEVTRRANEAQGVRPSPPASEQQPNLAWALQGGPPDIDTGFEFGVDLLIAGLEQRLQRSLAEPAPRA
ncbi:TetR/AcrR family transcriptional regulator C-terminal domain-containing protein [Phenylobacterium sp. NIBR 498073]|uniref:TetR/AcrR family transcriptional regulator C-terminal domain-containing protein n=1 Tax=Phenylobacterium sp. NIBR 498073 TaxID=3015177 RepID=UPI0022B40B4B|nr:TetR/AcrR family transcriptional regulator C-terminal domain-containing protein [Phenylobacterium sp. NIBR 498073]MBS0489245.1 TetR/AcrR family transcriptional regulator C-terminal domain-containing protein [Pseudomonadota bacterium]WGU41887.1 TetR/AcrR family transcriptional regulator C-terminal domain-containing protein [Phenylobacterium sp. NIBR 498073]